jgi:O-antigen/teichoic acid export membrane protein
MSLAKQSVGGAKWMGISYAVRIISLAVTTIVLARLVEPRDFGILAAAMVVTQLCELLFNGGLAASAVQRKSLDPSEQNLIFWMNVTLGVAISVVVFFAANSIARLLGSPDAAPVLQLLCVATVFGSAGVMSRVSLERALQFRALSLIDIVATIVSSATSVALGYLGYAVIALASKYLVYQVIKTCMWYVAGTWRPSLIFSLATATHFLRSGGQLSLSQLFYVLSTNADRVIISKLSGERALGFYSFGLQIVQIPSLGLTAMISSVLLPALSLLQSDLERLKLAHVRTNHAVLSVSLPLFIGLLLVAKPLVLVAFGEKWLESVPIVCVFCGTAAIVAATNVNWTTLIAIGAMRLRMVLSFLAMALTICGYLIGASFGAIGVALGGLVAAAIFLPIQWHYTLRSISGSALDACRCFVAPLISTAGMAAIVLATSAVLPPLPALQLAVLIPLGAVVYVALQLFLDKKNCLDLVQLILSTVRGERTKVATDFLER